MHDRFGRPITFSTCALPYVVTTTTCVTSVIGNSIEELTGTLPTVYGTPVEIVRICNYCKRPNTTLMCEGCGAPLKVK